MSRAFCGPIFKRNGGGRGLASVTTESAVRQTAKQHTDTSPIWLRAAATVLVPLIALLCCEWIHRGKLNGQFWTEYLGGHIGSYLLTWVFLIGIYLFFSHLAGRHTAAVLAVGLIACIPAAVTRLKLDFRGEPFLPWDLSQWQEAAAVANKSNLKLTGPMWASLAIFAVLAVLGWWLRVPVHGQRPAARRLRLAGCGAGAAVTILCLLFYLSPTLTQAIGIWPDMWLQDRYYRNYGVLSGFLTNLQQLQISEPEDYSEESLTALKAELEQRAQDHENLFPESPASSGEEQTPHIIYIMAEAFWDPTDLPGIEFSEDPLVNYHRLQQEAASGRIYSPSFGGGTCDVEFEALTGFSVEPLPMGCKPFQQHVTHPMFSLPWYLSDTKGYETVAVHCYWAKYWSRDRAYPNLGFDDYISLEDFDNPEKKRSAYWTSGLVSDDAMADEIIAQFEERSGDGPLFLHAVTMEAHSTYTARNFPEEELLELTAAPSGLSSETVGALRDFATAMKDTDAMLGRLTDYFSQVDEPVILVFWGDHYNLIGSGYELYEKTGFIEQGDYQSPALRTTPLLIWSNYQSEAIDLGVIGSYMVSPVMMELYGLEQPLFYQLHLSELPIMRSRSRGVTVNPDGSYAEEMTEAQQAAFDDRWLAQYDLMFGEDYLGLGPAQEE